MKPFVEKIVLFLLLTLPFGARAQENAFSVDADYMTRGEIRDGGLSVSKEGEGVANSARFILGRTRLGASYTKSWLTARLTAQHAGTWGSSEGSNLSMYEAWVQMQSSKGFFAKVGRQSLSYDDQRIFGSDDWSMTGSFHDGLKAGFEHGGHKIHLFGGYNQNVANMSQGGSGYSGGIQPYKSLAAVWYHYDVPKTDFGASLLFVDIGVQSVLDESDAGETFFQKLAGTFLSWKPDNWDLEAAYYYQWGKEQWGIPIDAWMTSVKAVAKPSSRWAFRAGYDYLSGDENFAVPGQGEIGLTHHDVVKGFSSLYGSHHKFYGAMDFFYVTTYVYGFTPGLQNLYAGATWTLGEKLSMDAAYHFLSTAAVIPDAKMALGHELELSATWTLGKEVSLSAGYSFMKGTETMSLLKRSADHNRLQWAWVMLRVMPNFFTTKW